MSTWRRVTVLAGVLLSSCLLGSEARAQAQTCTGVAQWNSSTIYSVGQRLVFQNTLYEAAVPIWNTPPNHCPSCGWYRTLGPCGGTDTTAPTVPANLRSTSQTTSTIALAWNASTDAGGVAGYQVLRGGTVVGQPTTTSFTDTGLAANTLFSYTVRARDNAGNLSAASAALSVRTAVVGAPCNTLPSVPTGLASPTQTNNSISLTWNASTPGANCTVRYRVFQGTTQAAEVTTTSHTVAGLAQNTAFTFRVAAINQFGTSAQSAALTVSTRNTTTPPTNLPARVLVGYWHNFNNGSGVIKLRDVSPDWDVINIAFGEPVPGSTAQIGFTPDAFTSTAEMISDIQILHSRGKKVLLSVGGANGHVELRNATERDQFVNSVTSIIRQYGLDGLDVDFEGQSVHVNAGDSNFLSPTTPVIVNLIAALRQIRANIGSGFVLTMAPETFFVQVGFQFYGGVSGGDQRTGAYLPVIQGVRDILTLLHVQDYNSGPVTALDGRFYNMGNADFHVAMTEMLMTGFTVSSTGRFFTGLRPDQVAIGLPANVNAGNGWTPVPEVQRALNYLVRGQSFGGQYVLRNAGGYRGLRGLMSWSINWDRFANFDFSRNHRTFLNARPTP
jgi:chitinase